MLTMLYTEVIIVDVDVSFKLISLLFDVLQHIYLMFCVCFTGVCHFPSSWSGRWFQSGVQNHLTVNTTSIETKGTCVENDGDKFSVEDR